MTALMVTEGDRRRAALELQRAQPGSEDGGGDVAWLDDARRRLAGDADGRRRGLDELPPC